MLAARRGILSREIGAMIERPNLIEDTIPIHS